MLIISVSISGAFMAMNFAVSHSADPIIQHQSTAVAESYLDEIMLQSYTPMSNSGGRATYNDVRDYHGLNDTGAKTQNGVAISGLEGYDISVQVSTVSISSIAMQHITVSVIGPDQTRISLNAYKANHS